MLRNKHILIGVTGGIAAYKIPLLVRELKKAGAAVRIVMTEAAREFVTPLTLSTL
ncbi:MAG: bifunctional 4'-phosphopantothenoylcysteine decarboxylase/phosphopantothenoylcysteine synthetase, partial [Ignavibacteria bacterium]